MLPGTFTFYLYRLLCISLQANIKNCCYEFVIRIDSYLVDNQIILNTFPSIMSINKGLFGCKRKRLPEPIT